MINVDELIKARIERFNKLYVAAVGHTFEEDQEWCKQKQEEEMSVWQSKVDEYLNTMGFKTLDEFYASLPLLEEPHFVGYDWDAVDEDFKNLLQHKPNHSSLYGYDMMCLNQAKEIVLFLESKGEAAEMFDKYAKGEDGKYINSWDFVENLKKDGFDKWDDGHSGNSGSMAVRYAAEMIFSPDIFPYEHGALSALVGDAGYHDDRSDIPEELLTKNKKDED